MALFAKLDDRPKQVEATQEEKFICVGGFSNPLSESSGDFHGSASVVR
jgi:hypothetical protein